MLYLLSDAHTPAGINLHIVKQSNIFGVHEVLCGCFLDSTIIVQPNNVCLLEPITDQTLKNRRAVRLTFKGCKAIGGSLGSSQQATE